MAERPSPEGKQVDDAIEAERMAHAMKPHVERAQAITQIHEQNSREDELAPEGTSLNKGLPKHEFDRELHLEAERVSLSDAEYHARKAADEAGAAESEQYRQEHGTQDT
jgi:hypothetical protein